MTTDWLSLAREIFSLAQAGLTYNSNEYDLQRYRRLREISAGIIAGHSNLDEGAVMQILTAQVGYATPKVDVRAAVFKNDKLLLVQERADGCWTMPGGWADVGEAPSEAVKREVQEESGFEVQVESLAAVLDANRVPGAPQELFHAYKLLFMCSLLGGDAHTSFETPAVDFFDLQHLPTLSSFRTTQQMIREAFSRNEDPSLPVIFDKDMLEKKITFKGVIEDAGGGGAYVRIPFDVEKEFGKKRLPVQSWIDGEPYRSTLVRMGGPFHILAVLKEIRQKLGKNIGDEVEIVLEEDTAPRIVEIPPDLLAALESQPGALEAFRKLSYTHQKEHVRLVLEAKQPVTRQKRILKAMDILLGKK